MQEEREMEKIPSLVGSLFGSDGGEGGAASMQTQHAKSSGHTLVPDAKVSSIFIYPIKSCRGISVQQATITSSGFRWDRQWVIVNSKGRACTQRVEPKLALIDVELPNDAFEEDWVPTPESYLVLRAPDMDTLKVSLNKSCEIVDGISVWEWSGSAYYEGHEAANWLTKYTGKQYRLLRFNDASEVRSVDPVYAPGHKTKFSDGFPFMLISQESLNSLNALLKESLPINRFRPNILADACEPYAEDTWKVIKINKLVFRGVKLCARCKVPTINQENGIAGTEPTETLIKIRSDKVLRHTEKQGRVYFGQNLVCTDTSFADVLKVIRVGDPICVLEKFSSIADVPV